MLTLSPTEDEILEVLWKSEGMTNNEIILYFRERGKEWKRQTSSTFLARLMQKGLLTKEGHRYRPSCTKEEFRRRQAKEIIDSMYDGSLSNFIAALNGGEKMTGEEAEELKKLAYPEGQE